MPILGTEVVVVERCEAPARTVRAMSFAAIAVVLLLALRARSDGAAPPVLVVVSSFGLLAALVRPLTARERSWPMVFGALIVAQLALHIGFLFASTGQSTHAGNAGLFCSPPTAASHGCLPTERGGLLLLSVQLLVAALFACWVRGVETATWRLARQTLRALVAAVHQIAVALLRVLIAIVPVALVFTAPQAESPATSPRWLFVREHGRRGPPRRLGPGPWSLVNFPGIGDA